MNFVRKIAKVDDNPDDDENGEPDLIDLIDNDVEVEDDPPGFMLEPSGMSRGPSLLSIRSSQGPSILPMVSESRVSGYSSLSRGSGGSCMYKVSLCKLEKTKLKNVIYTICYDKEIVISGGSGCTNVKVVLD